MGKPLLYKCEDQSSGPQHLSQQPGEAVHVYDPIAGGWTWVDPWNSWASIPQSMVIRIQCMNTHESPHDRTNRKYLLNSILNKEQMLIFTLKNESWSFKREFLPQTI